MPLSVGHIYCIQQPPCQNPITLVRAVSPIDACTGCHFYTPAVAGCRKPLHIPCCVTTEPRWRHVCIFELVDPSQGVTATARCRKWPKFLPD